jgi:two-component system cell cycle sensor histidine kinase/response regulator CckA
MKRSGEKAVAIVQDLLTLARRGAVEIETVDLNQLVAEYIESPEFERLARDYPSVEIRMDLAPDLRPFLGASVHLSKTVMNLTVNAFESIQGTGQVTIRTGRLDLVRPLSAYESIPPGPYATLQVSDTGGGIAPGDMERIFEPFFTRKKMGRSGSGLGMAVVWGTVKDHRGFIDVESTLGVGTSFTLYFPDQVPVGLPADEPADTPVCPGRGETVLIVDDIRDQREIASAIVRRLGYQVRVAGSGEEAIEIVREAPVDLMVLDMIMPAGIDGLETYRQIKSIRPGQRAIITSGFSESDRVHELKELGVGIYLKKPYTMEQLGQAIRSALDR